MRVNWETGTQLLNLVKALSKWMHNAGVQHYKDALRLLYDFAHIMATPRDVIIGVSLQKPITQRARLLIANFHVKAELCIK